MRTIKALEKELEKLKPHIEEALSKTPFIEQLESEYRTLKNELEGMKEHPENWKGIEDHPWTHVKAIKLILKKLKGDV